MFSEDRAKWVGFKSLDMGNIDSLFPMLCFEKESFEVPNPHSDLQGKQFCSIQEGLLISVDNL